MWPIGLPHYMMITIMTKMLNMSSVSMLQVNSGNYTESLAFGATELLLLLLVL